MILNMDLSYLRTSLQTVFQKNTKSRDVNTVIKEQKTVILPNVALLNIKLEVFHEMARHVSGLSYGTIPVRDLPASLDANCRGSPTTRAP